MQKNKIKDVSLEEFMKKTRLKEHFSSYPQSSLPFVKREVE